MVCVGAYGWVARHQPQLRPARVRPLDAPQHAPPLVSREVRLVVGCDAAQYACPLVPLLPHVHARALVGRCVL